MSFQSFSTILQNKTLIIILVIRIYLLVSLIKKFICWICPCWVIRGCPEKHVVINDHISSSSLLLSSCDIESNWIQVLAQIALNWRSLRREITTTLTHLRAHVHACLPTTRWVYVHSHSWSWWETPARWNDNCRWNDLATFWWQSYVVC